MAATTKCDNMRLLPSSLEEISRLVEEILPRLREGGIIAIPTDTIYGFACLAQNVGLAGIYLGKKKRNLTII